MSVEFLVFLDVNVDFFFDVGESLFLDFCFSDELGEGFIDCSGWKGRKVNFLLIFRVDVEANDQLGKFTHIIIIIVYWINKVHWWLPSKRTPPWLSPSIHISLPRPRIISVHPPSTSTTIPSFLRVSTIEKEDIDWGIVGSLTSKSKKSPKSRWNFPILTLKKSWDRKYKKNPLKNNMIGFAKESKTVTRLIVYDLSYSIQHPKFLIKTGLDPTKSPIIKAISLMCQGKNLGMKTNMMKC